MSTEIQFNIPELSNQLDEAIKHKINNKTKPLGSLGHLEKIAFQIARIQETLQPQLSNPHIVLVGADHGICAEGVSPCPQELTWQQMHNFAKGGGGIGLFSKQYGLKLSVLDAGTDYDFASDSNVIDVKVRKSTRNFAIQPAMTKAECVQAIQNGANFVKKLHADGCNVLGFGEMGIGNTSPASIIMSIICNVPIAECVGPGSGLDHPGVQNKARVLAKAMELHGKPSDPLEILCCYGGLEIATIAGGMLQAAALKMLILNDGFIITSALLIAQAMNNRVLDYVIHSHQSNEGGHQKMMQFFKAEPVLNLDLRLGEGTGAALAYPIIEGAVAMLNHMTSFEEAEVTNTTGKGIKIL